MDQYLWVSLSRYFVEVRREPDHVAGEPNLWLTFRRIYGDRASLFRAILACISHPNKLPLDQGRGEQPGPFVLRRVRSETLTSGAPRPARVPLRRCCGGRRARPPGD